MPFRLEPNLSSQPPPSCSQQPSCPELGSSSNCCPLVHHLGLVNAVNQDPALLLNHPVQPQFHYLFDCGDLTRLSIAAILRIRRLFLTHAHIDHIIGFDQILRAQLFATTPLSVYGPPGTIKQIGHRLQGYYWNLTGSSVYQVEVHDLYPDYVEQRTYHCNRQFGSSRLRRIKRSQLEFEEGGVLRWFPVFHGLPCIGFRFQAPCRWSVMKESLEHHQLKPGPWLQQIKDCLQSGRDGAISGVQLDCSQTPKRQASEWGELLFERRSGASMAYVTDTLLDVPSRTAIAKEIQGVEVLVCEATYSQESLDKATANLHATAQQAALLALEAQVGCLKLTHLSRRYNPCNSNHLREAREVFPRTDFTPTRLEPG